MMILAAVSAFLAYCLLLSHLAQRHWPPLDRYVPNALAVSGFWALAYAMSRPILAECSGWNAIFWIPVFFFLLLIGFALAFAYVKHLMNLLLDEGAKVITGVDRLPPHPRFDKADKAVAEKRYEDAVRIYLESAAAVPSDPEPVRRAGEASLLAGRDEAGLAQLRRALDLTKGPEDRASLGFRIAELLERRLSRPDEARELLVTLATDLKGTRFETYAWDRHAAMAGP